MRKNAQRVFEFQNDLVNEIKNWVGWTQFEQIEFTKVIHISVEVDHFGESAIEIRQIKFLTEDGFVIDSYGEEINSTDLSPYELAYILDELDESHYIVSIEKEPHDI